MSLTSDESPTTGLSRFFRYIWKDTEGFVYLPTLNRKTNEFKKLMFAWPKDERGVIQHVLSTTAKGLECYYAPAIFKSLSSPVKDNVKGTHVLWAEFDGDAPTNWQEPGATGTGTDPEAAHEAHTAAGGLIPPPSLRVQSSNEGHEHCYWELDNFLTDKQWIEDKNRSITYTLRADTSGWDCTQILRPPFTTNYKRDQPVTVMEETRNAYQQEVFAGLKPPAQIVNESIVTEDLPTAQSVVAKYPWDSEHFKLFMDSNIPEGERSSALMRLGYFCAETGMSDTEAYAVLLNADDRWGKYKHRADRKRRLVDIVNRARSKYPHAASLLTFDGLKSGRNDPSSPERGLSYSYGFREFLQSDIKVEWAVEGLLEKGGMGMIAAAPGVGKTQMSIQLAICMALGEDFLDWKIREKSKVVLLSLEMGHVGLKMFLETIAKHYTEAQLDVLEQNVKVMPIGERIPFDRQEGMEFLYSLMDDFSPDAIIIDALNKTAMDELNEKTARTLNDQLKKIRDRYKAVLWLVHHNRKANGDNSKPAELSDVYGNVYLTGDMSSVLVAWHDKKMPKGHIEIINVKNRYAEERDNFIVERDSNLHFEVLDETASQAMLENLVKNAKVHKGDGYKNQEGSNKPDDEGGDFLTLR